MADLLRSLRLLHQSDPVGPRVRRESILPYQNMTDSDRLNQSCEPATYACCVESFLLNNYIPHSGIWNME